MDKQQAGRIRTGRSDTPFSHELRQARQLHAAAQNHLLEVMATRQRLDDMVRLVRSLNVRVDCATPVNATRKVSNPTLEAIPGPAAMFDDMTDSELDVIAERLLTAYCDAEYRRDDESITRLRGGLLQIGRLIAGRMGPKAAGLKLH